MKVIMMKNKNQVHQKKMKIYLTLNGMNSMINVLGSIHSSQMFRLSIILI